MQLSSIGHSKTLRTRQILIFAAQNPAPCAQSPVLCTQGAVLSPGPCSVGPGPVLCARSPAVCAQGPVMCPPRARVQPESCSNSRALGKAAQRSCSRKLPRHHCVCMYLHTRIFGPPLSGVTIVCKIDIVYFWMCSGAYDQHWNTRVRGGIGVLKTNCFALSYPHLQVKVQG